MQVSPGHYDTEELLKAEKLNGAGPGAQQKVDLRF